MDFFFLSQLIGRPVRASFGDRIARVKDLVARLEASDLDGEISLEAYPPVSGLVIDIDKRAIFVPWSDVKSLGPEGALLSSPTINMQRFERREGEVLLARDILDKQLIDIDGRRVIRANDLKLYAHDEAVRLMAVDVGGEALLRRLTFGRLFTGRDIVVRPPEADVETDAETGRKPRRRRAAPIELINWADVEPLAAGVPDVRLRLSHDRLRFLNPVDLAHIADDLSYKEGAEIIESLDDETAADTLQEMGEERQADIVESMDQERAADILEEMDPDDAADLLADLDEEQAQELLRRMDREDAEDVEELLAYDENTAGGIMTSDFITVPPRLTVDEGIILMRSLEDAPDVIDYFYVVEEDRPGTDWIHSPQEGGKLLGIVNLRDFLMSPGDRIMEDLMDADFVWVGPYDSREKAARILADYNLLALPVIDQQDRMVGIITIDDAIDVLVPDERWLNRIPRVFS